VPQLRQPLGRLDAEAVEVEVVLVLVRLAQLLRRLAGALADGDELHPSTSYWPTLAGRKKSRRTAAAASFCRGKLNRSHSRGLPCGWSTACRAARAGTAELLDVVDHTSSPCACTGK
jgi:hypothetical protein